MPASALRGQRPSSIAEALEILPQLRKRALAGESDIVLCFESVLDFIPAAWACICGGYSWIPWHLPKLSSDRDIRSRLQVLDRKLNDPVLLATDRIIARIASLERLAEDHSFCRSGPGTTIRCNFQRAKKRR